MHRDTLPLYLRPLMDGCTVRTDHCVVCGRTRPLNQHHVVRRGAGNLYRDGARLDKPTLTLCGSGNASGCHGLAHEGRLHFRWVPMNAMRKNVVALSDKTITFGAGHWEWKLFDDPTRALDALQTEEGWHRCV